MKTKKASLKTVSDAELDQASGGALFGLPAAAWWMFGGGVVAGGVGVAGYNAADRKLNEIGARIDARGPMREQRINVPKNRELVCSYNSDHSLRGCALERQND